MPGPSSTRRGWRLNGDGTRLDVVYDDTVLASFDTTGISFFDATPAAQPSAYTQTYATADKTHAAVTQLAAPAGGTGATGGAYDTAGNRDLMITSVNAARDDIEDLKQLVNSVIDDLQALGILQ